MHWNLVKSALDREDRIVPVYSSFFNFLFVVSVCEMGEVWFLIIDCNSRKSCWIIDWLEFMVEVSIFFNIKTEYEESEIILIG